MTKHWNDVFHFNLSKCFNKLLRRKWRYQSKSSLSSNALPNDWTRFHRSLMDFRQRRWFERDVVCLDGVSVLTERFNEVSITSRHQFVHEHWNAKTYISYFDTFTKVDFSFHRNHMQLGEYFTDVIRQLSHDTTTKFEFDVFRFSVERLWRENSNLLG